MLIDTHAHLYLEEFSDDLAEVVSRCDEYDVGKVILPNIDLESIEGLARLSETYSGLFLPAMGLHPCSVKGDWEAVLSAIRSEIESVAARSAGKRIYGIGETGLDYYWDTTFKAEQEKALRIQAGWAREMDLPIILHCRDSFDDLYRIISEEHDGRLKGIFHCFTGSPEEAAKIIELGTFLMGIGGVITFNKSEELRRTVADIPMEFLVLETDAPYLTPAPFRGKRNESSYIKYVAEVLAQVKQIDGKAVADITTANAAKIFVIKQ